MVKVSNDVAEFLLKKKFEKLTIGCNANPDWNVLIEHFGGVNAYTISTLSDTLENKLLSDKYSKNIKKKAFAIIIEGLQNIYRHGLPNEDSVAVGAFVLLDGIDSVQLHFLNLIQQESVKEMDEFCQKMNSMSLVDIKQLYLETLSNADLTEKGGASLGCMLMKLKSDGNLDYAFEDMDKDMTCFHLTVSVHK